MKTAYLKDADQAAVSAAAVEFLKARGALVTEHTHSHVRFEGLNPGREFSFSKGGYVGIYHHVGEKDVEMRLRTEATVPARIFWWTVVVDLAAALLLFVLDPPSSTWVSVGAFLYAAFFAALLLYLGTWRSTWHVEADLFDGLLEAAREGGGARGEVLTEDEREIRAFEEDLAGELTERQMREGRKAEAAVAAAAPKGPKPRRELPFLKGRKGAKAPAAAAPAAAPAAPAATSPAGAAADESPEEKRARLEAMRAELERRRREGRGGA